jgi:hypothetical protein
VQIVDGGVVVEALAVEVLVSWSRALALGLVDEDLHHYRHLAKLSIISIIVSFGAAAPGVARWQYRGCRC